MQLKRHPPCQAVSLCCLHQLRVPCILFEMTHPVLYPARCSAATPTESRVALEHQCDPEYFLAQRLLPWATVYGLRKPPAIPTRCGLVGTFVVGAFVVGALVGAVGDVVGALVGHAAVAMASIIGRCGSALHVCASSSRSLVLCAPIIPVRKYLWRPHRKCTQREPVNVTECSPKVY